MPFSLDSQPTVGELSESVNYLLGNLIQGLSANEQTGQIIAPGGNVVGYLYKYLAVKYADSFDGTVNFSNSPTNRLYYGLRNSDSAVESTNPADYVWYQASGGFGTTKFLFYLTSGGRSVTLFVGVAAPSQYYKQDPGTSIDLDFVTAASTSPSNFAVIRSANDFSPPTDAEVLSAIGRLPLDGDLCIVNYNGGVASIQYRYTGGWVVFQKILTGDLIVANTITATNIAAATITGTQIAANTVAANNMVAGTITAASGIIADAAIVTAKINNLAVDTAKIANNAVSASVFQSSGSSFSVNAPSGSQVLILLTVRSNNSILYTANVTYISITRNSSAFFTQGAAVSYFADPLNVGSYESRVADATMSFYDTGTGSSVTYSASASQAGVSSYGWAAFILKK